MTYSRPVDPNSRRKIKEVRNPPKAESPWKDSREAVNLAITEEGFRAESRVFGSRKTITEGMMQFSFDEWIGLVRVARLAQELVG